MAPKTTQQPHTGPHPNDSRIVEEVREWAKQLWTAVQNQKTYVVHHDHLFKEFDRLRDAIKSTREPILHDHRCLVLHVSAIYNHTASQGYQPEIHYKPLSEAVTQWCLQKPVKVWQAPPDQHSRSASPAIPPEPKPVTPVAPKPKPRPVVRLAAITPTPAPRSAPTKAEKGKGKAKAQISPEYLEDTDSDGRPEPRHDSKPLDPLLSMKQWDPKCKRCSAGNVPCHIHPNRPGPGSACVECNVAKVRCSLVKHDQEPSGSGSKEKEEVEVPKKGRAGGSRKRPTAVPAGEIGGEFFVFFFVFIFEVLLQPWPSPPPPSPPPPSCQPTSPTGWSNLNLNTSPIGSSLPT